MTWRSDDARLDARPSAAAPTLAATPGEHVLDLGPGREGLLYVPPSYVAGRPAPLALTLHGAGGQARSGLGLLRELADEAGLVLVATGSQGTTWDRLSGYFGPDLAAIDAALAEVFAQVTVDGSRLAIGGFSDGASYALAVGLPNGDLFTHILAFSPGFLAAPIQRGTPRIYISHGTDDRVLPIERCSRRIVPALRAVGYEVHYHEFEGPHTVPPEVAREAVEWFTRASPDRE